MSEMLKVLIETMICFGAGWVCGYYVAALTSKLFDLSKNKWN